MTTEPETFGGMTREDGQDYIDSTDAKSLADGVLLSMCKDLFAALDARNAEIARLTERIEDERRIHEPWRTEADGLLAKVARLKYEQEETTELLRRHVAIMETQQAELAALRTVAEAATEYEDVRGDDAFQELHYALAAWRATQKGATT